MAGGGQDGPLVGDRLTLMENIPAQVYEQSSDQYCDAITQEMLGTPVMENVGDGKPKGVDYEG